MTTELNLSDYDAKIIISPNDYKLYKKRAYLYAKDKNYIAAIDDMQMACSIKPSEPAFYFSIARWQITVGKFKLAIDNLDEARLLEKKLEVFYYSDSCYFLSSIAYLNLFENENAYHAILRVESDARIHIRGKLYTKINILKLFSGES